MGSGEPSRASVLHLVPFGEEASHVVADAMVDRLIGKRQGIVAEVAVPIRYEPPHVFAYVRPRALFARRQQIADSF